MGADQSSNRKNFRGLGEGQESSLGNNINELSIPGQRNSDKGDRIDGSEEGEREGKAKRIDKNGNKSSQEETSSLMTKSTLVVVKSLPIEVPTVESDPLMQRLNSIPHFLPIIDNSPTRKFPWSKPQSTQFDSKLNTQSVIRMGRLYNGFVRKHTTIIVKNQGELNKEIKQVEKDVDALIKLFITRQRRCAHYALKLGQVAEISKTLSKCQTALTDVLKTTEILNELLPEEERLEEFQWCREDWNDALNVDVKEETPVSVSRLPD